MLRGFLVPTKAGNITTKNKQWYGWVWFIPIKTGNVNTIPNILIKLEFITPYGMRNYKLITPH
jgi:hypothetical protein